MVELMERPHSQLRELGTASFFKGLSHGIRQFIYRKSGELYSFRNLSFLKRRPRNLVENYMNQVLYTFLKECASSEKNYFPQKLKNPMYIYQLPFWIFLSIEGGEGAVGFQARVTWRSMNCNSEKRRKKNDMRFARRNHKGKKFT